MSVIWGKDVDPKTLKIRASSYFEFLSDLEYEDVKTVLDDQASSLKPWMPRPMELRVETLTKSSDIQLPPTSDEAWVQLQRIQRQVELGTYNYPEANQVLKETLETLGSEAALSLTTNGDRKLFANIYDEKREAYIRKNFNIST